MQQGAERTLILIHGRGTQPDAESLRSDWLRSLNHGLDREHGKTLDGVNPVLVYYGDRTEALDPNRSKYDPVLDRADRQNALEALQALRSKDFRRARYEAVPGQSPLKEFLTDLGVPLTRALGLANKRLAHFYPELDAYWHDEALAEDLRERLTGPLVEALHRGDHIMVISHCIGTVLAYDAFWAASQATTSSEQRVHSWVTLGSPLADDDVRRRLDGQPSGFPNLLINWFNLAAEDDPVCHDETVANDFKAMLNERHISRIQDYHIYNLTERYGRSDPHDAFGYLHHPRTASLLNDWLNAAPDT
jgi:hypothetical protein